MSINNKIRRFLRALRFWKWTAKDFRKAGVDTRYASEIVKPDSPGTPERDKPIQTKLFVPIPEWNKLVIQKLALAKQLKAARHALSVIENMTYERTRLLTGEIERIHKLAHEDCREATK